MSSLFDDFAELEPIETARYPLASIRIPRTATKPVVLLVRHAGRNNPGFMNARAKLRTRPDQGERVAELDANDLAFAPIVARHVIVGWENVSENDASVTYTPQLGEEMLRALVERKRPDILTGLMMFVSDPDNFRPEIASPEDVGKP